MDMYVPNWGLNVPVTKAGVEGSCLPETRLTSHQSVWGRRFPVLAGFRAEWEPGAIAAPSCSPLDAQAPSPWIFHVLTENLLSPGFLSTHIAGGQAAELSWRMGKLLGQLETPSRPPLAPTCPVVLQGAEQFFWGCTPSAPRDFT